ncbi:hypothetical protein DPMN_108747 [Dreissena polymorpha]|uniref:C2H2-type domain-containing protein n=1 Tax=Dreissena polymorpha TaxID=45954 RepID=A0A9D4K9C1_DREPO|nr:hypothetical protein DPMN_108747 [Dreissena polymorpha]
MFGLMILGRMCGQGGLHYIMMQLCIQQHVNLSQQMLMLLNDVEKNPGPEYSCKWISCKEDFHSIGQQDAHIISHVVQEKCCRWGDCTKVLSFNSLEIHALKHLYDVSLVLCELVLLHFLHIFISVFSSVDGQIHIVCQFFSPNTAVHRLLASRVLKEIKTHLFS